VAALVISSERVWKQAWKFRLESQSSLLPHRHDRAAYCVIFAAKMP